VERRTQAERSAAMQQRLLDATVSALVECGYRGTTTLEVQKRAEVSRGALLHHYTSRSELMLAAIDHLTRERLAVLRDLATQAPPQRAKRVEWAVRVLWSSFEGPMFSASLELWLAARSDADLRAALIAQERLLGKEIDELAADLFGAKLAARPRFRATMNVLFDSMRGASIRSALRTERSDDRLITGWVHLVEEGLR
jgi:AcrR family transcriptional regulator